MHPQQCSEQESYRLISFAEEGVCNQLQVRIAPQIESNPALTHLRFTPTYNPALTRQIVSIDTNLAES